MAQHIRRLVANAVMVPLAVMAVVAVVLAWEVRHLVSDASWVDHTDLVIAQANRTQKLLLDMETGTRGFLLTNDSSFLTPYDDARAQMAGAFDVLASLVSDNPLQLARVARLRARYEAWNDSAGQTVERSKTVRISVYDPLLRNEMLARKVNMDEMRALIVDVLQAEEAQRARRETDARRSNTATALSALAVIVLLGTTLVLVTRKNLIEVSRRFQTALDAERRAREGAEEALKIRENFLQMASHELKTPVTSLRLQLESMLRTLEKSGEATSLKRVEQKAVTSLRQLTRLQDLIGSLLDVQRLGATGDTLIVTEVDAVMVVHEALARIDSDVRASGCSVTVHAPPQLMVKADPMRLDQVVTNLVTNALKYGRKKPVTVTLSREGERVFLRIKDEGIGIETSDQARIFERFERAVSGEHFHGFGLGLWIVKSLLEKMGGSIRVESARGAGSTFIVELAAGETDPTEITASHARSALMKLRKS
jgi:signal transduction histidine kinase